MFLEFLHALPHWILGQLVQHRAEFSWYVLRDPCCLSSTIISKEIEPTIWSFEINRGLEQRDLNDLEGWFSHDVCKIPLAGSMSWAVVMNITVIESGTFNLLNPQLMQSPSRIPCFFSYFHYTQELRNWGCFVFLFKQFSTLISFLHSRMSMD